MFVVLVNTMKESEVEISSTEHSTLEEAWQEYNKAAAGSHTLSVWLLVPLKEFKR